MLKQKWKVESQDVHVRPGAFSKDDFDPDAPTFVPGRDWQPVLKGQAIPPGLHVRLNMETGEREAKLLDGDDGSRFWRQGKDELDGNDVGQIGAHGPINRGNVVKMAAPRNSTVILSLNRSDDAGDTEL